MMSIRRDKTYGTSGSFWHLDAADRLRILLPEFLLSVAAMTCMAAIISFRDGSNVTILVVAAGLTQLFVQTVLYAGTYLVCDQRGVGFAWAIAMSSVIVAEALLAFTGWANSDGSLFYACAAGPLIGLLLFYATRLRGTFVFLLIELLALADAIDEIIAQEPSMLLVHLVCIGATIALFVMRSSAARITMDGGTGRTTIGSAGTEEHASHALGIYGQVAALAAATSVLCLIVAFAGTPAAWRLLAADGVASSESVAIEQPTEVGRSTEVDQSTGMDPAAEKDRPTEVDLSTEADSATETGQSAEVNSATGTDRPTEVDQSKEADTATGVDQSTDVDSSAETDRPTGTDRSSGATQEEQVAETQTTDKVTGSLPADDAATPEPGDAAAGGLFISLLLLALLVLPIPVRLLVRRLVRYSLEWEPQAANRAAKIYLGIISRLAVAGIVRDETETPAEFLSAHEDALVELVAPAGMGIDEWLALTDIYEKVRYAGLDPTTAELEVCWRLYDALPTCTRAAVGWPRYLARAFWRM